MAEKYPRGDPTPIISSIEKAAKILRARGIIIDLTKEMPHAGDPDYWYHLNKLHEKLWSMVYAGTTKTQNCTVTHIHDDGDATLNCDGVEHVATTEGKLYREISDLEITCHRLCKEGPPITLHTRRLIPEDVLGEIGKYVVENTKEVDVDPLFVDVLVKSSDRRVNITENYEAARKELLTLFKETLEKMDPGIYDKFKGCLHEV